MPFVLFWQWLGGQQTQRMDLICSMNFKNCWANAVCLLQPCQASAVGSIPILLQNMGKEMELCLQQSWQDCKVKSRLVSKWKLSIWFSMQKRNVIWLQWPSLLPPPRAKPAFTSQPIYHKASSSDLNQRIIRTAHEQMGQKSPNLKIW